MARNERIESTTGIYHVMLRGINRQNIFENHEDYRRYKACLETVKKQSGLKLLGYCLMSNHIHIALVSGPEPIGTTMKRLSVRYVSWYNRKYNRLGPLFHDRFKSEPIEDDTYLLSLIRYIHRNPVQAGLCKNLEDYEWSSFAEYMAQDNNLVDTTYVLEMFFQSTKNRLILFREFTDKENADSFMDISDKVFLSDESVRQKMKEVSRARNASEFQALSIDDRNHAVRSMKDAGISIRQIARVTGISFGVIRNICRT